MRTSLVATALASALAAAALPAAAADPGHELRVGVLPDADSLPLLVAEAEGLFAAEGVAVRLLPFKTALERDAALQAGAVDGAVSDLLAAALAAQAGFDFRVTSLTDGRYGIVTAPGSGLSRAVDLAGVPVGISTNTVIQYAVDALLSRAGLPQASILGLAVPKIQVRMELLLSGQLKAACLPEPLLTVARRRGATLVAASDDAGFSAGVVLFSLRALDSRQPEVAAFYRAYWRASQAINANDSRYRAFLVEKALFPEEARDAFLFVRYAKPRLPSEAAVSEVLAWMRAKGLLSKDIPPASLMDGRAIGSLR
jgi:NitT/TauT family transport system substrate-binding protein